MDVILFYAAVAAAFVAAFIRFREGSSAPGAFSARNIALIGVLFFVAALLVPSDERVDPVPEPRERTSGATEGRQTEPKPDAKPDEKTSRCELVPSQRVRDLASYLENGVRLRRVRAVRSRDFEKVYFIAAELDGPGLDGDNDIGVWATNDIEETTGFYAVDGYAEQFSSWPDGDTTDAAFSLSDEGASEARGCATP